MNYQVRQCHGIFGNYRENGKIDLKKAANCPICGNVSESIEEFKKSMEGVHVICPACGDFQLSHRCHDFIQHILSLPQEKETATLSYAIRRLQEHNQIVFIDTNNVRNILEYTVLPTVNEQLEMTILRIGKEQFAPGRTVELKIPDHRAWIGAINDRGASFILNELKSNGLLDVHESYVTKYCVSLTASGWNRYDRLKEEGSSLTKKAFMAMQFNDDELDWMYREVFVQAVRQTGFVLMKLDDVPKAGLIDDRLRVEIRTARFMIADLSHGNAGAYWEAGFAEGLGKPVIYTCKQDIFDEKKTHFDTNHCHTIKWSKQNAVETAEQLKATIRATLPSESIMTDK